MEYKQIQELIKTINKSSISELSIEEGDFKITIDKCTEALYIDKNTVKAYYLRA